MGILPSSSENLIAPRNRPVSQLHTPRPWSHPPVNASRAGPLAEQPSCILDWSGGLASPAPGDLPLLCLCSFPWRTLLRSRASDSDVPAPYPLSLRNSPSKAGWAYRPRLFRRAEHLPKQITLSSRSISAIRSTASCRWKLCNSACSNVRLASGQPPNGCSSASQSSLRHEVQLARKQNG